MLLGLGTNVVGHRDYDRARGYLEAALSLCRELGHLAGIAECLQGLGSLALRHGDLALAGQWLDDSRAALRIITAHDISSNSELLGELAYWQGNYAEARGHYQELLRLSDELGHQLTATWATIRLGYVEMQMGNVQAAAGCFPAKPVRDAGAKYPGRRSVRHRRTGGAGRDRGTAEAGRVAPGMG